MFEAREASLAHLEGAERVSAIREAYTNDQRQMTMLLAHQLGVKEVEILRAITADDLSVELNAERWEEIIRAFEPLEKVHVIVSNGASTIEAHGQFGKFSNAQGFFNVQSGSLDMHIRSWELAAIFAVRKPSHLDGHETVSFQFFDRRGDAAFKVFLTFGGKSPSPERYEQFEGIVEEFKL